jgi:hypothetical protein
VGFPSAHNSLKVSAYARAVLVMVRGVLVRWRRRYLIALTVSRTSYPWPMEGKGVKEWLRS